MGRVLTLAPDRRLDRLFNDVLGLDAAWLRGVPHARLAAMAHSEKMPPSVFRWELDRLRRFGGDGPMPRGCHLDGSDIRTGVFDVSLNRLGPFQVLSGAPLPEERAWSEGWLFESDGSIRLDLWS